MTPKKFTNDILKPYDELNALLVQRFAFEPSLSDVTRLASAIATSIRHIPEAFGYKDLEISQESPANKLIIDVSDAQKHGKLNNPSRNNNLNVSAAFEYEQEKGFRFLRNKLYIVHSTLGEHDFLATTLNAIRYWEKKLQFKIQWNGDGKVLEAPEHFSPTAFLFYEPQFCISMEKVQVRFFKKINSTLVPIDPEEAKIEIFIKGNPIPKAMVIVRKKDVLKYRRAGIKSWKPNT